ncbi:SGNH/GDSL hydrolase family protein [Virgibacillus sp. NKC19-16]|uniref:SGNH/GDSL hydrolase family protein n=1 Tax=Virgibacillus salidurans TaxID=2831673 RepID=UPI001F424CCA|nr:SGNH/GDSL hydrolase family protein [Virgibacillus sp. NKC19-16]UJL46097.1 SGNH/GDSL hydrolase family protein [Virgibacillus sp. NKC19-16]
MKKKNFMIAIFVLIIGAGIFALINRPTATLDNITPPPGDETETTQNETNEEANEEPQEEEEETEQSDETDQRQFSTTIFEAFQETVDFFTNRDTHIVAVGDSLTQGVGSSDDQGGYVEILDRAINAENQIVSFDNFGIRGDRSDQLLERLDNPEVSNAIEEADIVLITIGANDIMKVFRENFTNLTIEEFREERVNYEERLNQIFTKLQNINPNTDIYLLGFYNPFEQYFQDIEELGMIVESWNRTGSDIAEEDAAITFIPTVDLFNDPDADLFADDNFHPNDRGYQRMARRVMDYLTNEEG